MYIPITFLGSQESCIECLISGSYQPDNVAFGNLNDEYFWIRVNAGGEIKFTSKKGISNNAKMLVVGGGGYSQAFNVNPLNPGDSSTGGGGAGQVIFQDFTIQPDIEYFASASIGGRSTSQTGGSSTFIENYVPDPVNWIQHTAVGGDSNTTSTGGDSGDGFTGGTGATNSAGGGGAGSTGDGQDKQINDGGDGGDGYTIPSPFDSVVTGGGTKIAGGGPGASYQNTPGAYASGVTSNAYGNGASAFNGGNNNGNDGVVFLFFPISGCETGSRIDLDFEATGGSTGTFDSGSVRYKYHIFTNEDEVEFFNVTQGVTNEARIIAAGGGAGSSAESYNGGIVGGGAGAGGVEILTNVSLFGYTNLVGVADGGAAFTNGGTTNFDSIIHSGQDLKWFGGGAGARWTTTTLAKQGASAGGGSGRIFGDASGINIGATSNRPAQGNDGGDGYHGIGGTVGAGGGGGGAGSNGGTVTTSHTIAGAGGDGYDISTGFYSYLTGSFNTGVIGHGGGGTGGELNGAASSSFHTQLANDGSGANPNINASGSAGFLSIVYPISGSVTNSAV